jgi:hypothetical protein
VSVRNELVWVTFWPVGPVAVAVTVYRCDTPSAQLLCQAVAVALSEPVTAPPAVLTVTFVILPWAVVTVIP